MGTSKYADNGIICVFMILMKEPGGVLKWWQNGQEYHNATLCLGRRADRNFIRTPSCHEQYPTASSETELEAVFDEIVRYDNVLPTPADQ